jgi:hypothetical protein
MHIPIHIPIGSRNSVVARGAVWKMVQCTNCSERYACQVELAAVGRDVNLLFMDSEASVARARTQALQHLSHQARNAVAPIPCPNCGNYPEATARQMKESAWMNRTQIVGGVIVLASLIFLALPFDYLWIATIVLATIGMAIVAYGYVLAYRYDPNGGDPEPRKAIARSHAVWGQKLDDLIASGEITDRGNC